MVNKWFSMSDRAGRTKFIIQKTMEVMMTAEALVNNKSEENLARFHEASADLSEMGVRKESFDEIAATLEKLRYSTLDEVFSK